MSAIINRGSSGCLINQETPAQNLSASRKVCDAVKGCFALLACLVVAYTASRGSTILFDLYDGNCSSLMRFPLCPVYAISGVSSAVLTVMAVGKAALIGLGGGMEGGQHQPQSATQESFLVALHDPNPMPFFHPSKTAALPIMPKTICKACAGNGLEITIRCDRVVAPSQSKKLPPRLAKTG